MNRYGGGADEPSPGRVRGLSRAVLSWLLAGALLASVAGAVYVAVAPPETTDPYTEFYVLGPDGTASGYPTNLSVGETGTVIVGVSNHEHETVRYTVVLRLGDRTVGRRTVTVADGETWEEPVSFAPRVAGRQRLEILLYEGPESDRPYRRLRLWVTVSGNESAP